MSALAVPFPWRLRLDHPTALELSLERRGRTVRFDPASGVKATDIVVLTGSWPDHLDATAAAARAGLCPTVMAAPEVLRWLEEKGAIESLGQEAEIDGVSLKITPYTPIPWATRGEAARKAKAALTRPGTAARRLAGQARSPKGAFQVAELRLEDGGLLLHLNHALHGGTPEPWLTELLARAKGAEWLIAGIDYEEHDAFERQIRRFEAHHLLLADLFTPIRQRLGLPTRLLTPLVDRLVSGGQDAYVFPNQSTFRFETA